MSNTWEVTREWLLEQLITNSASLGRLSRNDVFVIEQQNRHLSFLPPSSIFLSGWVETKEREEEIIIPSSSFPKIIRIIILLPFYSHRSSFICLSHPLSFTIYLSLSFISSFFFFFSFSFSRHWMTCYPKSGSDPSSEQALFTAHHSLSLSLLSIVSLLSAIIPSLLPSSSWSALFMSAAFQVVIGNQD